MSDLATDSEIPTIPSPQGSIICYNDSELRKAFNYYQFIIKDVMQNSQMEEMHRAWKGGKEGRYRASTPSSDTLLS